MFRMGKLVLVATRQDPCNELHRAGQAHTLTGECTASPIVKRDSLNAVPSNERCNIERNTAI